MGITRNNLIGPILVINLLVFDTVFEIYLTCSDQCLGINNCTNKLSIIYVINRVILH